MQRGFAHLLFLVVGILVVLGIVVFVFFGPFSNIPKPAGNFLPKTLQKPLESSNLTYTNLRLNFKFEYSKKDLIIKEDSEEEFNKRGNGNFRKNFTGYVGYEPGKFQGAVAVLEKEEDFENALLNIWIFENPDSLKPENWFDKYWYYPFVWGDFTYSGKQKTMPVNIATISGQLSKSNIVDYRKGKPEFLYIPYNGKMYLITFSTENKPEIVEEILESFKFLENTSKDGIVCIQVITPAKNEETGECKEFPTPCDVPEGWEKVESCSVLE